MNGIVTIDLNDYNGLLERIGTLEKQLEEQTKQVEERLKNIADEIEIIGRIDSSGDLRADIEGLVVKKFGETFKRNGRIFHVNGEKLRQLWLFDAYRVEEEDEEEEESEGEET